MATQRGIYHKKPVETRKRRQRVLQGTPAPLPVGDVLPAPGPALPAPRFYLLGKAAASEEQLKNDAFLVRDFRQGFLSSVLNS